MKRYFRCSANLNGPLLVLDSDWEADEMKTNPDYFECDIDGLPVVSESAEPPAIPFRAVGAVKG